MANRSASSTIKGYVYQFDKTILEILNASNNETIRIEDIEDIGVESSAGREAIQCKYLPSKKYSLSVIREATFLMFQNMLDRKKEGLPVLRYHLYAYFKNKSPKIIRLKPEELKECFKKREKDGTILNYIDKIGATNKDINFFLSNFRIEISESYDSHKDKVFEKVKMAYGCSDKEIEFYYNNALSEVSLVAADTNRANQIVKRSQFIKKTHLKKVLYSIWRLQDIGKAKYCKELRKQYFTISNIPPYARFFMIELNGTETQTAIKSVLMEIRAKWSSHAMSNRKHTSERYAPYIFLNNILPEKLARLKEELYNENIRFTDGFAFFGANFDLKELNKSQTYENKISLRFINESKQIPEILNSLKNQTKEIYQFYQKYPIAISPDLKNIQMKINDLTYIKEIV